MQPPQLRRLRIISGTVQWAQTFPASRSGKLLTVDLTGIDRQSGGTGADIEVDLYGTDGTGTPVAPLLASASIPGASIPADNVTREYSVDFNSATAAYLVSGKNYAIALNTSDTAQNSWSFGQKNQCTEGTLFIGVGGPPFGLPEGHADEDAGLSTYLGPANDDFEHAELLSGQNAITEGTTAGASRQEPDEPDHYTTDPPDSDLWVGDHSVWYRWTAPNSGPTTIDTCIGEIDSILAVYTGSQLNALTRVADNNNDPACTSDPYGSKVSFEAKAGTTYDIAVGDAGGAREKPFALTIKGAPDTTPPETEIDSGPSGATTDASPSFTFSSEPGATFECRFDSNQEVVFSPCVSPKSYSSLALGPHTFEVRAIDEARNVDPTPAIRTFTVEAPQQGTGTPPQEQRIEPKRLGPPNSIIRRARIDQAKSTATFTFISTEPESAFLCKLDRKPFRACKSHASYRHLKPGKHRFQVEAENAAGGLDPTPAVRTFIIKP